MTGEWFESVVGEGKFVRRGWVDGGWRANGIGVARSVEIR